MKLFNLFVGMLLTVFGLASVHAQKRPFTVKDDIEMIRFSDPDATQNEPTAKFSPDGRLFAVVTSRGILKSDEIESDLLIFSAAESEALIMTGSVANPQPKISIKMRAPLIGEQTDTYGSVIRTLRWSSDSQYIYFLGESPRGDDRLYRLDVAHGATTTLSPQGYSVVRYDFTHSVVVYSAHPSFSGEGDDKLSTDDGRGSGGRAVSDLSLERILFSKNPLAPTDRSLWVVREVRGRLVSVRLRGQPMYDNSWLPEAFAVSPQGHMLVQLKPVSEIPANWERYQPPVQYPWTRIRSDDSGLIAPDNVWRLKEYALVNLDSGKSEVLVPAPQDFVLIYPRDSNAMWSQDEKRLILTNTFLPLEGVEQKEQTNRLTPCAVAEVLIRSRVSHCVLPIAQLAASGGGSVLANSLSFGATDAEIRFTVSFLHGGTQRRTYIFGENGWSLRAADSPSPAEPLPGTPSTGKSQHLSISVKQSLNHAPTLWGTDIRTGKSKELWDPNPQFADLLFGEASVYRWKDKSGHEWKGGLVKPVGYVPGQHYPLVIQIYNFNEAQFLTDGIYPTAFAARHLASAGIMALQIQRLAHTFEPTESDSQLVGIEGAIDHLAEDGLIDQTKVGLIGFSSTCWYVENALIRAPKLFAAATIADGIDMSYIQYRLWSVSDPTLRREFLAIIGAEPFGEDGLKQWVARAPGFRLDHMETPLRIEAISPGSVLGEWETYSSLKEQGKPVDLIYFPAGQHIHQMPLERLESQQGDVDWFRFWLEGYRDPDPRKQQQYRRWEQMKIHNAAAENDHARQH